jgi:transposase
LTSQFYAALLQIEELKEDIMFLKNGRNRKTSSTPSSQDYGKKTIYNSRTKTGKKSGGQKGHEGNTLEMSKNPEKIEWHIPQYCNRYGE